MITDLQQALAKISEATGGDLYDANWQGGSWLCHAVKTDETLENYETAAANYAECGRVMRGELAGFPFVYFGVVQPFKGHQRRELSVIDLGEARFALDADLTDYV